MLHRQPFAGQGYVGFGVLAGSLAQGFLEGSGKMVLPSIPCPELLL
jgi:hypothetical protein